MLYAIAANALCTAQNMRCEGVTIFPPGDEWISLALRCLGEDAGDIFSSTSSSDDPEIVCDEDSVDLVCELLSQQANEAVAYNRDVTLLLLELFAKWTDLYTQPGGGEGSADAGREEDEDEDEEEVEEEEDEEEVEEEEEVQEDKSEDDDDGDDDAAEEEISEKFQKEEDEEEEKPLVSNFKFYFCYACGDDFDTWRHCKAHLLRCPLVRASASVPASSPSAAVRSRCDEAFAEGVKAECQVEHFLARHLEQLKARKQARVLQIGIV